MWSFTVVNLLLPCLDLIGFCCSLGSRSQIFGWSESRSEVRTTSFFKAALATSLRKKILFCIVQDFSSMYEDKYGTQRFVHICNYRYR